MTEKNIDVKHSNHLSTQLADEKKENLLLSAASPVLSQISQLRKDAAHIPMRTLQTNLAQLIERFMETGKYKLYSTPIMLAGRYMLSAALDDLITHATWNTDNAWKPFELLPYFNQDPGDKQRFFVILQRSCDNPEEHIDLIELGYHCLSLGYIGSYRHKPEGEQVMIRLMDRLYSVIKDIRGEPPLSLMLGEAPTTQLISQRFSWSAKPRLVWAIWGGAALLYFGILLSYNHKLNDLASPAKKAIASITQTIDTEST